MWFWTNKHHWGGHNLVGMNTDTTEGYPLTGIQGFVISIWFWANGNWTGFVWCEAKWRFFGKCPLLEASIITCKICICWTDIASLIVGWTKLGHLPPRVSDFSHISCQSCPQDNMKSCRNTWNEQNKSSIDFQASFGMDCHDLDFMWDLEYVDFHKNLDSDRVPPKSNIHGSNSSDAKDFDESSCMYVCMYVMLCYVMLCYVMLCYVMLCNVM